MKRFLVIALPLLALSACGSDSPAPAPTPVPACQANNTATLTFQNSSVSGATYDVLIDGVRTGSIAPGQASPATTVAASAAHTIVFRVTNTSLIACSASPVPAQCSTQTLTCRI